MSRNFIFFINPVSGTKNKDALKLLISRRMKEENLSFQILDTRQDCNYDFLPAMISKEQVTDIIICGGDGTVNQVASAILQANVNVGIIPMGSGNGLAFTAGIPKNAARAMQVIINGNTSYIDSFYLNDHFSCMLCGIGFDARVAHDFAKQKNRGLTTYIRQTVKNFFRSGCYPFIIMVGDIQIKTEAFFISIANSNQFGNNVRIAPGASLNDGLLDIVVVNKMNKFYMIWSLLRQVGFGKIKHLSAAGFKKSSIHYFQAKSLSIQNPSLAPLHIDGEPSQTNKNFEIRILQNAFRLLS